MSIKQAGLHPPTGQAQPAICICLSRYRQALGLSYFSIIIRRRMSVLY